MARLPIRDVSMVLCGLVKPEQARSVLCTCQCMKTPAGRCTRSRFVARQLQVRVKPLLLTGAAEVQLGSRRLLTRAWRWQEEILKKAVHEARKRQEAAEAAATPEERVVLFAAKKDKAKQLSHQQVRCQPVQAACVCGMPDLQLWERDIHKLGHHDSKQGVADKCSSETHSNGVNEHDALCMVAW